MLSDTTHISYMALVYINSNGSPVFSNIFFEMIKKHIVLQTYTHFSILKMFQFSSHNISAKYDETKQYV